MPALVSDEGKVYTQSMAMIEWLDERYPEPPLMPRDTEEKWYVRAVSQIIGCEMHPLNNVRVLKYLKSAYGLDDARVNGEWYPHWVAEGFAALRVSWYRRRGAGRYCLGECVTMADVCLAPQVFNAQRFNCDLASYPAVMAIFERCMKLPAFSETQPSKQADAGLMLTRQPHFEYSAIVDRPQFSWPGGKRLAFHLCLNLEAFAWNTGLGISYSPGLPHPNSYNWGWREYGNRVGVWRLLKLFDQLELPVSLLLNSECYEHCPEVVAAFRERGDEIVGHGRTNSEHQNDLDEAGERQLIADVTEAIRRHEGKPPAGWLSPGVNPSKVTPDLLQEAGYRYLLDWPMDDQPVWMKTRSGRILSVPYPHEVNDIPMIALHHGTADRFADIIIESLDEMLEQSQEQALVYGVSIHAFLVGQPFRLRYFRRAMEHVRAASDRVWFATTGRIAAHYAEVVPA